MYAQVMHENFQYEYIALQADFFYSVQLKQ